MAHDPKTEEWISHRRSGEHDRLRALEVEVAKAWFASLTLEQREVYSELCSTHHGLANLDLEISSARHEARRREGKA